ncbi:MAG: M67 family metallopeptidase [Bacteroidota bacterium]
MKITKSLLEKLKAHARRTYPEECCGILLGRENGDEKVVSDVIEIDNARNEQRERRFLITPQAYQEADKEARKRALEILGFYHSHPDHPAWPSQYDLEHAWAWFSYMITSVEQGEPKETSSWVLREDRSAFDQEEIKIES